MNIARWLSKLWLVSLVSFPLSAGEWTFKTGAFWSQTDSSVTTKSFDNQDITLDFEDSLQLEKHLLLPFFELGYKFNQRHHVYADWRRLHRSASSKTNFGFTLPNHPDSGVIAGANLNTRMDIDILSAGYGYSFYQNAKTEIGGSLGLHVMFIEMGFSGDISACVNNAGNIICNSTATKGEVVDESATAPLPDIGLWTHYQLTDDWTLNAHSQFFYLKIDQVKGYLADLNASISYQINPNWDIELGYNYYIVEAEWDEIQLKYNFQGPMVNFAYRF
ncbi:hypothetical protein ACRRS0_07510 [Agarivorans sp. QJM3NY_29]|uniref:hypothetical protein n=1 Tax=unclassified Agarivorans TaxID=2636026 RepID=UPI003D7CACA3